MLEDVLKTYRETASVIHWKDYSINDLFFNYIKHENEPDAENWYAGIICRVWGYSARLYEQCKGHVPFDQCYDALLDAVNYVIKKRVWENPESSLYNDPAAPDKAFHISLKRSRSIMLAKLNAYKRRTNFNVLSLDKAKEDYADAAEGLLDIGDLSSEGEIDKFNLINKIKTKEPIQIIMLDQVCFSNWNNFTNIITNIKGITEDDFQYYNSTYGISEKEFTKILKCGILNSNKKLKSELKKILYIMKKEQYD